MQLCPFKFIRSRPSIPELDFSGMVLAIGSSVPSTRNLSPGALVFGSVPVHPHLTAGVGALAQYIVVEASSVVIKPSAISLEQAAGLGVSGCTALMLIARAELKAGDRVCVNGASGGIGTMVVQLAKNAVGSNGEVVAVCSGRNTELVKKCGADQVSGVRQVR